jgi:Cu2+-exporting ATPase
MLETERRSGPPAPAAGRPAVWGALPGAPAAPDAGSARASGTLKVVYYEVAHQLRGRVRLRIPRLAHDGAFARRLSESVGTVPSLEHARISARSCSLVVTYRPGQFGAPETRPNGRPPGAPGAILPLVVERVRIAAGADLAQDLARTGAAGATERPAAPSSGALRPGEADRLVPPALAVGLSAAALAGVALPGPLIGGAVLFAALPIFKRTAQGIRDERRLPVDLLDALTIVLMTAQGSFLVPALVVGVIEGAELIRDRTARPAPALGLDLLLPRARDTLVERSGGAVRVAGPDVGPGDVVLVRPGDRIPVDGVVLEGEGLVDEHQLTGVAAPVPRRRGDRVWATTLLLAGSLRLRTMCTGHETWAAGLMALARRAPGVDTRVSNHARRVGNPAVVPTLAVGAGVLAATGSVARATSIVGLDLGTGMRVSAPIAVLSAQARAARHGILIRSGRALEQLARVTGVAFDKTATLTTGRLRVVDVRAVTSGTPADGVLLLAASAERALVHPVAGAVVACARERGIAPLRCARRQEVLGEGVVAEIGGERVHVGSRRLLERAGVAVDEGGGALRRPPQGAVTPVFVAREGQLVGVIWCRDALRPESAAVVADLDRQGVASSLVTGDQGRAAAAVATALAIPRHRVFAGARPRHKAALVEAIREQEGPVAFVGDGINDVPAMARADASVALGGASDLARETADVVLLNDDLRDLLLAVEIARHAVGIVEQNRSLVVVPNVAAMVYGTLAAISPVAAAVINNGTALVAAANSLRPLGGPYPDRPAGAGGRPGAEGGAR